MNLLRNRTASNSRRTARCHVGVLLGAFISAAVVGCGTVSTAGESIRIRLAIGDRSATGSFADNPTARDFASLLPITISINDLLGQEKTGDLPRELDESGDAVFTYEVGQIGYWAPSGSIAILYVVRGDGGIPDPGLIPLGTVDEGLDVITNAPDGAELTIELLN